ncbi:HEAT repeat domain-containing protein [uncultured Aureimonas sp.]|uniref:HEAT repeat domain-containing protein n=1 Tax=uncultured Aureimonas sp. TaxID=1604662 RepID=UPI0025E07B62|nr:HEAT repeat domain-containing protein [uncultured Aureimonas sp.]
MGLVKAKITQGPIDEAAARPAELDAADAASRRAAARVMATRPGSEGDLLSRLAVETDRQVREAIVLSLIGLGTEVAVLGLAEHLGGEDVELRNAVVEALESMPRALEPHLDRLLVHDDADVRIFVCNVLAGLRHAGACEWLKRVLERDRHPNVCAAAIDAMMEAGTPDCIPSIRAAMARFPDEPFLAFSAELAIARIERP